MVLIEFLSVNDTSIYENSESNIFKNIKFSGEASNNWPNNLLETNVYKTILNVILFSILFVYILIKSLTVSSPYLFNIYSEWSWISDIEYDPSGNSKSLFHVGIDIEIYYSYMTFLYFFHV